MIRFSAIALAGVLCAQSAFAGPVGNACVQSERGARDVALCGCIQQVADLTLDRRDQRLAARFFRDPHMAQEIRMSDDSGDERFWRKYRAFGSAAETYCN